MYPKACPRDGGDLFDENSIDGTELVCLQCGYRGFPSYSLSKRDIGVIKEHQLPGRRMTEARTPVYKAP